MATLFFFWFQPNPRPTSFPELSPRSPVSSRAPAAQPACPAIRSAHETIAPHGPAASRARPRSPAAQHARPLPARACLAHATLAPCPTRTLVPSPAALPSRWQPGPTGQTHPLPRAALPCSALAALPRWPWPRSAPRARPRPTCRLPRVLLLLETPPRPDSTGISARSTLPARHRTRPQSPAFQTWARTPINRPADPPCVINSPTSPPKP